MEHYLDIWVRRPHAGARAAQHNQEGHPAVVYLALGPYHAVVDLVADLDHVGSDSLSHEALDGLLRIVVDASLKAGAGIAGPGRGHVLLARIRPVVAVVEVEQEFHACRLDALGERERGFQSAPAVLGISVLSGGIHEQAQAYPVESVVGHDFKNVLLLTLVRIFLSPGLLLGHPGDVSAYDLVIEVYRTNEGCGHIGLLSRGVVAIDLLVDREELPVHASGHGPACRSLGGSGLHVLGQWPVEEGAARRPGHGAVSESSWNGADYVVDYPYVLDSGPVFADADGLAVSFG